MAEVNGRALCGRHRSTDGDGDDSEQDECQQVRKWDREAAYHRAGSSQASPKPLGEAKRWVESPDSRLLSRPRQQDAQVKSKGQCHDCARPKPGQDSVRWGGGSQGIVEIEAGERPQHQSGEPGHPSTQRSCDNVEPEAEGNGQKYGVDSRGEPDKKIRHNVHPLIRKRPRSLNRRGPGSCHELARC